MNDIVLISNTIKGRSKTRVEHRIECFSPSWSLNLLFDIRLNNEVVFDSTRAFFEASWTCNVVTLWMLHLRFERISTYLGNYKETAE